MTILTFLVCLSLILLNILGSLAATYFETLIFLDTLGTAVAGLIFGPLAGVLVGLVTNLLLGLLSGFAAYRKFFYVNAVCGLTWGFMPTVPPGPGRNIILYILVVGLATGLISLILSVPLRCYLGFTTDHFLDKIGRQIFAPGPGPGTGVLTRWQRSLDYLRRLGKVFAEELLLSHFLDKTISTTLGVMFILTVGTTVVGSSVGVKPALGVDPRSIYGDLIAVLGAYYYIALGIATKTLRVQIASQPQQLLIALLGPLAFFGALSAFPIVFNLVGLH